jgi:hypothetical protein
VDRDVERGALARALRAFVLQRSPALFVRSCKPDGAELGLVGEEFTARALRRAGWTILARRLRTPEGEIDLVARDQSRQLVCVEIKTARPQPLPLPHALAGQRARFEEPSGLATRLAHGQIERLARAARLVGREHGLGRAERARIDLVLVLFDVRTRRLSLTHERNLRAAPPRARVGKKWPGPDAEGVSPAD